jgi:hypothetical protein
MPRGIQPLLPWHLKSKNEWDRSGIQGVFPQHKPWPPRDGRRGKIVSNHLPLLRVRGRPSPKSKGNDLDRLARSMRMLRCPLNLLTDRCFVRSVLLRIWGLRNEQMASPIYRFTLDRLAYLDYRANDRNLMLCLKRMIDGWREFLGLTRLDGYPRVIVFRYLCEWLDICIKRSVAHSILLFTSHSVYSFAWDQSSRAPTKSNLISSR